MKREDVKCSQCGCRRFWLVKNSLQMVDFSKEGTIPGHPFLEGGPIAGSTDYFQCAECGHTVGMDQAELMRKLVV